MLASSHDDGSSAGTSLDQASVFFSYAREDEETVKRLGAALRANGREVWVDTKDIRGTEEWERAIDAGIESSDAVAFVLGPEFLDSVQCRRELDYAVHKGKRLVPLLAHQVNPADVPPELARLNWITLDDIDPAAVGALEEALDTDLDWVRTHTELLVRAVAWETRKEDSGLVLRGRPLADAERFLATASGKDPAPTPLHIRYVLAGRRAATRRQRATIGVVTVFLIVAAALAVLAVVQRNRAVHESNVATSRELAGSSTAVAVSDPELALLLAIDAMDREQTPEAVAALRQAVAQPAVQLETRPGTGLVTLSPDGKRAALHRPDGTLDVLDLASGRRVALGVERKGIREAAFAPGGRWLAATTDADDAILWDLQRERRQPLAGRFATLSFSSDGSQLLLVERGGSVAIVDPRSPGGQRVRVPAAADESSVFPGVPTAAFAPSGDLVVTWNEDRREAQVWDTRTGALRSTFRHGANITDAEISPEGEVALTAGRDMTVRFWHPSTGENGPWPSIAVPAAENDFEGVDIAAASFSPQSSDVVATLTLDHLQVWDARNAKLQLDVPNKFDYQVTQGFAPRAPYLLTGSGIHDWMHDRKVVTPPMRVSLTHADGSFESVETLGERSRVWSGRAESTLIDLGRSAWDVSSAGGRVAVGFTDGTAEVRDGRSGRVLLSVPARDKRAVAVELSPDGKTVAVSRTPGVNGRGGVELWRVGSNEPRSLDATVNTAIGFSADATRLLVFTSKGAGAFAVIDTKTGERIGKTFRLRTIQLDSVALSPNGQLFVQPTADTIDVYRVADGRRVGQPLRTPFALDVAVSPDNKLLVAGGDDGAIIWRLDSGRRVAALRAHEAAVTRVAFSPDGRLLLTRSQDGTLRIWEATTGAPVATWTDLPNASRPVGVDAPLIADVGLDFSASGDELLRADEDFVYRMPCPACAEPGELLARAKMDTRRSLTEDERRQYLHEGE